MKWQIDNKISYIGEEQVRKLNWLLLITQWNSGVELLWGEEMGFTYLISADYFYRWTCYWLLYHSLFHFIWPLYGLLCCTVFTMICNYNICNARSLYCIACPSKYNRTDWLRYESIPFTFYLLLSDIVGSFSFTFIEYYVLCHLSIHGWS